MPVYDRSPVSALHVIDQWNDGFGWLAHPDEDGARASHAIKSDDGVWVIDPIDAPGLDDRLTELGDVAGVAVLCSYHARDAGRIARRHDVSVHVPDWMNRVADRVDAPVTEYESTLGDSGFEIRRAEPLSMWQEAIAYRADDRTLIVPDLLGSGPGYTVGDERIGIVLSHRLVPPRDLLADVNPDRVLFGHGKGVFEDANAALDDVLAGARIRFPRALLTQLGTNLRLLVAAMKD